MQKPEKRYQKAIKQLLYYIIVFIEDSLYNVMILIYALQENYNRGAIYNLLELKTIAVTVYLKIVIHLANTDWGYHSCWT